MNCNAAFSTRSTHTVSVIIPVHNGARYLKQAIDSVLWQESKGVRIEIIVVDDGSTDATGEIARSYGGSIKYVRISHCGFPGAVRNVGLEHASGDFMAFVDSDDLLLPHSVALRIEAALARPEVGFIYGNYLFWDEEKYWHPFQDLRPPSGFILEALYSRNFINMNTVLVRRDLINEIGGFVPTIRTSEDYWLWLQLTARTRSFYIPSPLAITRVRPGSVSGLSLLEKLPNLVRVLAVVGKQFKVPKLRVVRRLNPLRCWLAKERWRQGQYLRALACLLRAIVADPNQMIMAAFRIANRRLEKLPAANLSS